MTTLSFSRLETLGSVAAVRVEAETEAASSLALPRVGGKPGGPGGPPSGSGSSPGSGSPNPLPFFLSFLGSVYVNWKGS